MRENHLVLGVVLVTLVAGVGGGNALLSPDGNADSAVTQQATGCDYSAVYDQSIDAVVSIQAGGGQGSGFVYGDAPDTGNATAGNGTSYVVTNAHVVGDADTVLVQFAQGEYRNATVVGQSVGSDLAVVRVDETPSYVSGLPIADSEPQRGQAVAALGNPFGLEQTITHGIVSGVNRSMPTQRNFLLPDVVQTDAAISPGNSGGPLIRCDGTVVGVNTAGIAAQQAENIGFAVSASLVDRVVPGLIEDGEYPLSYLGVGTREITPTIAQANDLNDTRGVTVVNVAEDGPASDVLQGATDTEVVDRRRIPVGGDVIRAVDGTEVQSAEHLATYLVTRTRPGDTVQLTVVRDGATQTVNVTVGERPDPAPAGSPPTGSG